MKFLSFGDLHLGAGTSYAPTSHGSDSRLADQEAILSQIYDAADDDVGLVLFAGDAFHRRRPSPTEIQAWKTFVERLASKRIPLLAIAGNHDVEAYDRPTALELVSAVGYDAVRYPGTYGYALEPGGVSIGVAALPWTPPSFLAAGLGAVPRDELNAKVADLLLREAAGLYEGLDADFKILLAHWSVTHAKLPNGLDVGTLREPVLPLEDVLALGYDLVVLGHIHLPQILTPAAVVDRDEKGVSALFDGNLPLVQYVGSPGVIDFGEADYKHGFYVYDLEFRSCVHVLTEDRRFVTVDVDLTTGRGENLGLDETDTILAAAATHAPLADAVVRVRYRATPEQARRVTAATLRAELLDAGAAKVYSISADIVRSDRVRVEGVDETLAPLDALDAYVEANFPALPRHRELRDLTTRYLEEEK